MTEDSISIVFDLGGVLVDWNPRYLYRKLFDGDEKAMESFLAVVCTSEWHYHHDLGRSFAEGVKLLSMKHPDKTELIDAWGERFDEMIGGAIEGTVDILAELRAHSIPVYSLTNYPHEAFSFVRNRFDFIGWFKGVVVSGEEKVAKPDPQIYRILIERYGIDPRRSIFIDDLEKNIAAAEGLGFTGIQFSSPEVLRAKLKTLRVL
jgi:2-haloacid dehalogenase